MLLATRLGELIGAIGPLHSGAQAHMLLNERKLQTQAESGLAHIFSPNDLTALGIDIHIYKVYLV